MWFRKPERPIPADKEIPPLRTWIISWSGGVRESVHAHEMVQKGDDMVFYMYTGGRWVTEFYMEFGTGLYWNWTRKETYRVALYTSIKEMDNS